MCLQSETARARARAVRFARRLATTCLAGTLLLAHTTRQATRDKPPAAHTGGFGEATCQTCHSEADVNAGGGSLTLSGVPQGYTPGERYTLTITLVHPELKAGGFEIAARFEHSGAQAGSLAPHADERARSEITTEAGIQYAHHVYAGTEPVAGDTARWQIVWDAPLAGGVVVFHAVGNGSNGDASPLGDYVYARSASTSSAEVRRTDGG